MRVALGIEYDGHAFYGWQKQTGLLTVQENIETALTKIAANPIQVFCAGRTDAGVHAIGQVIHFDTEVERPLRAWTLGTNSNLPPTIAVRWAQLVDEKFHARFSATARHYRYVIYNHSLRSALMTTRATWYQRPLDIIPMQTAATYLLGEQDFSSFRSAQCESSTPMRNVHEVIVRRHENLVVIDITANAFLHHMVRNIVGVLLQIGTGLIVPETMADILAAKDRKQAGETAPADGLYLIQVDYPKPYAFPQNKNSGIAAWLLF